MFVVVQSGGCDGAGGAQLNYFSTKDFALEFAIEALGNVYTVIGWENRQKVYGLMKDSGENFEQLIKNLKRDDGVCGNGMHADDTFCIEIFEVPSEPEK